MEDGFYWVRTVWFEKEWRLAERTTYGSLVHWEVLGTVGEVDEEELAEIGERLTPPA